MNEQIPLLAFVLPLAGMFLGLVMGTLAIWTEHKRKEKVLELLQDYARQGKEPTEAALEGIYRATSSGSGGRPVKTRAQAYSRSGFFLIMGLGFGAACAYFYQGNQYQVWVFTLGMGIPSFVMLALSLRYFIQGRMMRADDK